MVKSFLMLFMQHSMQFCKDVPALDENCDLQPPAEVHTFQSDIHGIPIQLEQIHKWMCPPAKH